MNVERTTTTFIMLPQQDWQQLQQTIQEIHKQVAALTMQHDTAGVTLEYIPAAAFMKAVNIKRTKLHELITSNSIRTLKKKRKVYVLATEVSRYFRDPSIQ